MASETKTDDTGEPKVVNAHQERVDALCDQGANIGQLCRIFKMDRRDLVAKLAGRVDPIGKRGEREVYRIRDVAPYLVKVPMTFDFDDYFARLSSADLPPAVNKDFWAAKRAHLAFLREKGEVVPLKDVATAFSMVFKGFRTSALLFRDALERNTVLTDPQRKMLNNMIDTLLETAHGTTINALPALREVSGDLLGHRHPGVDDVDL